ncbi:MAG: bifunctional demethylmenaquinone methyltransferase/2-methoxy-6-polyprenyl-1,4-benzoquinol methylase UbiE [Myxococcota bacterium]
MSTMHVDNNNVRGGSGEMFDIIASRYDLLNRVISFGLDQSWRRKAIRALEVSGEQRVLDLATGTADLAIDVARTYPEVTVRGLDPSREMLREGDVKVLEKGLSERVALEYGDGQAMPYDDDSFDGAIIGFGIRNFPDRFKGLSEMARVVRPGGKVVILELSEPRDGLLSWPARVHIHHVVPLIGRMVAGSEAYRYLQRSIEAFPSAEEFARMMGEAGLSEVRFEPMTFGVAHLYVGTVPKEVAA